jgi:3-hydroxymyristoyl/3-hydroxydecanoyl-(acyl carrier protein) dehydratase
MTALRIYNAPSQGTSRHTGDPIKNLFLVHDFLGLWMLLTVGNDHPALPGHFPDQAIVPAAIVLDLVVQQVEERCPGYRVAGVRRVKWLRPLIPNEVFFLDLGEIRDNRVRFQCKVGDELMAEGNLVLRGELQEVSGT